MANVTVSSTIIIKKTKLTGIPRVIVDGKEGYHRYLASREWSIRRELIRDRSRGWCERCWRNKMDAVHHLTYIRVGCEELEDLQAICDLCHKFTHGKIHEDPTTSGVKVYLAGPFVGMPDWRKEILTSYPDEVAGYDRYPESAFPLGDQQNREFAIVKQALVGGFDVTGPWRIGASSEHGLRWCHPSTLNGYEDTIPKLCSDAVIRSDLMFVWLPRIDTIPVGTIWEMGIAYANHIPIVFATQDDEVEDYWLPIAARGTWRVCRDWDGPYGFSSVSLAWSTFLKVHWPRMRENRAYGGKPF